MMKKLILIIFIALSATLARAQEELDFPFQGGKEVMSDYFAKHLTLTNQLKQRAATGTVIMKFTSDAEGSIIKLVVYYADDASLTQPVIAALKSTNGKWIIPAKQKSYDFIIPFTFDINTPDIKMAKAILQFQNKKAPIVATDQIPLNLVTLLPTVKVTYDYPLPAKKP